MTEYKDLRVIYEDSDLLVIDKPSGLVVNTSDTSSSGTLQEMISDEFDYTEFDSESEFSSRGGIVHRLDKDTSGVLLAAKNPTAFEKLKSQFKDRTIKKEYLAMVIGTIDDPLLEVNAPISRNPENRMKMAITKDGREALTKIQKIKDITVGEMPATLVRAIPETGRTHQIRVHLAALNHAIVGDPIYATRSQYETWSPFFSRLMLHAMKITFVHPTSGEVVSFESPAPTEFQL